MRRLRILTWPVHGSYMYYLSQAPHDFYLPVKEGGLNGYGGRGDYDLLGGNVRDIPAEEVKSAPFDVILFQGRWHYEVDQYELLSEAQRQLPRIYLEHDPPRESPTDTKHPVDDPNVLLVHVTHFNDLMWDPGRTPTRVVEHGVIVPPDARYTGELERGLVVVNNLRLRGRRLGADVFQRARERLPLDLAGMDAEAFGGWSLHLEDLHRMQGRYRFFLNPIRYTSLGLAVCEAMMVGLPIVGLATTEMVTAVRHGVSGYLDTDVDRVVEYGQLLLREPGHARELGEAARRTAQERFGIGRFAHDWSEVFLDVAGR
ncbi:group 1 glycosyl transferase [Deinococcus aerius]|uniref:Group 1 glycosyl transferase n=1 Tax=Deinococcus aerius TaxID=200253 RepID=A0A2I9CW01_9DEIO|nr:glycosyltransferase [Deinococcus aerius]GBF06143.1 group 1 glycosyl transferase [Deinococcus aerius]